MMTAQRGTKIERNIEKYNLDSLDDDIREQRVAGSSLRDLADFVNRRILEQALSQRSVDLLTDVDRVYEILTDDSVSTGRRVEVESKLRQADLAVDEIRSDFVSHQTVKHYLNDHLDIDTSRQSSLSQEDAFQRLNWAQSQNEAIIRNTLEQLSAAGILKTCEFDLAMSIRVTCHECNESYSLQDFVTRGECGCLVPEGDD